MIRVHARCEDGECTLSVRGHADYAKEDIVCAGVSAITYALLGTLENADSHVSQLDYSVNSGDVRVLCCGDETVSELFRMALIGYAQIAKAYPRHVEIDGSGGFDDIYPT